jgi:cysteinyl-tRNA synthetase
MALRIYDTLSRQKRIFTPLEPGRVRMYVCGPTVYAPAHIGHAMSAVVFDVIRRWLEHRGYQVAHVMNYTDVEDKILNKARELGVDPMELAENLIGDYDRQLRELNVLPAWKTPRASREIPAIVEMIERLTARGAGYRVDGDVYFRVARDEDYGKLSGRKPAEMQAGARIEVDARKEDPADFALWKAAKPGEPSWPSPWGPGRPGWHIECSAMNLRHLGEQIDIHGGGNDLIFPHHENEIAQTETLTGKPFAAFWVHNGMLQFSDEKMSKSLGNVVTVEEFLRRHEGDALRMLVLNSGYRKPLTFHEEAVGQAEASLERLRAAARTTAGESETAGASAMREQELAEAAERVEHAFGEAMDDDFNTAGALAQLFDLARSVNAARDGGAGEDTLRAAQGKLRELAGVLGLRLEMARSVARVSSEEVNALRRKYLDHSGGTGRQTSAEADEAGVESKIVELVEIRRRLREQKDWKGADEIRDALERAGVVLQDGEHGTTWRAH